MLLKLGFTEHLKLEPIEISKAYSIDQSYFINGEQWVEIINSLRNDMSLNKKAYYEGLKQVACHLIGICSAILNEEANKWFNQNSWMHHIENINITDDTTLIFKSIVFNPNLEEETTRTNKYIELNKKFMTHISEKSILPSKLIIANPIITYREIWEEGMESSIKDNELKEYLDKYLKVHA